MITRTEETEKLVGLAEAKFQDLTESEREMLHGAASGMFAYCGPNDRSEDPANDPAKAEGWDPQRTIRAAVVRWLCVESGVKVFVDPKGIQVHAARMQGKLNLSHATVPFPLTFGKCLFAEEADLTNARLEALSLEGSRTAGIKGDGLNVRGDLNLHDGFTAEGEVRLIGAKNRALQPLDQPPDLPRTDRQRVGRLGVETRSRGPIDN